jgi:putative membrane protein insertion efficiency factor
MRTIVTSILKTAIRIYQFTLSSILGNRCRFYPSCSQYMIEAIELHGPLSGVTLGVKRLVRCHPLCEGGVDLVPENHDHKHKA